MAKHMMPPSAQSRFTSFSILVRSVRLIGFILLYSEYNAYFLKYARLFDVGISEA